MINPESLMSRIAEAADFDYRTMTAITSRFVLALEKALQEQGKWPQKSN